VRHLATGLSISSRSQQHLSNPGARVGSYYTSVGPNGAHLLTNTPFFISPDIVHLRLGLRADY
jgi:hypothetical protein